jgi:mRNA interferase RelE/StbE
MPESYRLFFTRSAKRELESLPRHTIALIKRRLDALLLQPRPPGCQKLTGQEGYRVRQGDYRILYEVDDSQRTITIVKIRHRREVYRS